MSEFALGAVVVASMCSAGLLVYSGFIHLVRPGTFRSVVTSQSVIPFRYVALATRIFIPLQIVVGAVGIAGTVLAVFANEVFGAVLWTVSLLYFTIAIYIARVVSGGTAAPCGCFGGRGVANRWTLVRSCGLGLPPAVLAVAATSVAVALVLGILLCLAAVVVLILRVDDRDRAGRAVRTYPISERVEV